MSKKKLKILQIFIVCMFALVGKTYALVFNEEPTDFSKDQFCNHNYRLAGEIKPNDADKFIEMFNRLRSKFNNKECPFGTPWVMIDSTGGDVVEAIKLGRFIKQNALTTEMSPFRLVVKNKMFDFADDMKNGQCFSACVFVLAGGVVRRVDASTNQVGIHRPYFSQIEGDLSPSAIKSSRERLNKLIKDYFEEVDINPSLLDDMLSIPPEKIRILTGAELEKYRLSVNNANYEESELAKEAKAYNLSSGEYRKRSHRAEAECPNFRKDFGQYLSCRHSTILGISLQEWQSRIDKGKRLCTQQDEELKRECAREILILGK